MTKITLLEEQAEKLVCEVAADPFYTGKFLMDASQTISSTRIADALERIAELLEHLAARE